MNKRIFIILLLIVLSLAVFAFTVFFLSKSDVDDFESCALAGYPVMESYPRQCRTSDGRHFVEEVEFIDNPLIKVESPRPNEEVESPILISGKAKGTWYFEGDFPVKVFDENKTLLGVGYATALGDWMTEDFVDFSASISFAIPSSEKGKLILEKDNPSGLSEYDDQLVIPIYFKGFSQEETMEVKIFLTDSNYINEPNFDCSKTVAVTRIIPKTDDVVWAFLEMLIKGPTQEEIDQGFASNINQDTEINSIDIIDGVAYVDFNDRLDYQIGGSCAVTSIRAQITDTLKQFPIINEVVISINGQIDNILQP